MKKKAPKGLRKSPKWLKIAACRHTREQGLTLQGSARPWKLRLFVQPRRPGWPRCAATARKAGRWSNGECRLHWLGRERWTQNLENVIFDSISEQYYTSLLTTTFEANLSIFCRKVQLGKTEPELISSRIFFSKQHLRMSVKFLLWLTQWRVTTGSAF